MMTRHTLVLGNERFRVGPWHADPAIAYLALTPQVPNPSTHGLRLCLRQLEESGYTSVITAALHTDEAAPFVAAGFREYDRLHVLSHPLDDMDPPRRNLDGQVRIRRARRCDRDVALTVDHRAFSPFWRLDAETLDEALSATPRTRFRLATDGVPVGYAVTGRSGSQAFLQRLAVDPGHAGHGIGSGLVLDALRWAQRHRARRVLVNTQQENDRALDLYDRLGFEATSTDLVVLTRTLP